MESELFNEMLQVENHHWWFVTRRRVIETVIAKLGLNNNARIFDAGCGNGDNLGLLAKYGDVIAMETNNNALAHANARKVCTVYQGDLPDGIPKEINGAFDLITMFDVLEHIDNDTESMRVLHKKANKKGKLLITVPAYQFLWSNHDVIHHHKRRYTAFGLSNLLENSGWKINYISYFNTLLFPLALVDRIINKYLPTQNDSVLRIPPKYINILLRMIFGLECNFIGSISFPFGLSIIVLAEKE